ncbi:MAG: hypothetical protein K2H46_06920 [Muribaculaceae bacterium]|nr:hypothetical protein [Muribaculaceae bacterium]
MAKEVLELALENDMEFYISFLSVANFAYIMRKEQPDILRLNIRLLCSLFKVVANVETHFKFSKIPLYSPSEFLSAFQ